ncbi:MAG: peptide deformylase [Chromatiales bacterium]|jgi:peptide deformylase|nr:peptide deformylase [Chromatiales bacterium]
MAVLEVLKMGHPLLLQVAQPIERFDDPELDALIKDMFDTMEALSGAGLAAPQIGVSKRLVIFGVTKNARYPDAEEVPATILINPVIQPLRRGTEDDWEGCLSVPGLRGLVPRYTHIRYSGYDEKGQRFEREASGFHARVVQHECDHLDGILYPRRIRDLRMFGFESELLKEEDEGAP